MLLFIVHFQNYSYGCHICDSVTKNEKTYDIIHIYINNIK